MLRKRELVALTLIVCLMHCVCLCLVALPDDAVGWSAVCDSGISWSYVFTFFLAVEERAS